MLYERKLTTTFRSCTSITADVNEILAQSGVQEGLCVVSVPHTTAGLAITSFWDPRGLADLMDEIEAQVRANADKLTAKGKKGKGKAAEPAAAPAPAAEEKPAARPAARASEADLDIKVED